ncbi:MAG: hypothetical protein ABI877_15150 [Gemmatimonadaceae bacterium]
MSTIRVSTLQSARRRPGGPRRWSAAEKAAHLAAYATRGLGLQAYCTATGVPRATLTYWQRQARALREARVPRSRPTFARVEVVPSPPAVSGLTMVVRGPAGLAAELTGLDAPTAVRVLRAVFGTPAR